VECGFYWKGFTEIYNLSQTFIIRVGIAEEVFKVRGQKLRSYVYKCVNICYDGGCMYFGCSASRVTL